MKQKPHWFRVVDLLSIAGLGVFTAAVTVYAMVVGVDSPHATQGIILCWVVALTFIAIWGRYCWARKKWLDTFRWYPKYGFMVQAENYTLPTDEVFDAQVAATITSWEPFFVADAIVNRGGPYWCWMLQGLDESPRNLANQKVNGLAIPYTRSMQVDYDKPGDEFAKTAFAHELGHLIMGEATGEWDLKTHHDFMASHRLR